MRRLLILCTAAAILLLLLAAQALPHDYWLEPERFFLPAGGGRVRVRMHVGEHLKSEAARPLQKARTADFRMFSSAGAEDLLSPAREGQMPVAEVTLARDGNYLFVMERKATEIKLDAEKFRAYLVEEGLEPIIAARERAGESGREGRERYSRYLKSLVQVGGRHDATYGRKVGHRLEITPLVNPYALRPGASLPGLVEFDGKPLGGVKVFALDRASGGGRALGAETDADGRVSFKIRGRGVCEIRLVHMRRCAGADCGEIEWESFWAAYTFGVR